jgi:hypothetical protein
VVWSVDASKATGVSGALGTSTDTVVQALPKQEASATANNVRLNGVRAAGSMERENFLYDLLAAALA